MAIAKSGSKYPGDLETKDGCYFYVVRVTNSTASGRERKIEHKQKT